MTTTWTVLASLAVILVTRVAADRSGLPAAVLLVAAGLVVGVVPGPTERLEPELVLELVIPPLLFAAARSASLLELRANARIVGSLSVALVLVTAFAVAGAVDAAVPAVGFAAALALGAAVAPPDPVAALAIGRRAGLPRRLTTLVEGEGLLNDATALTLYGLAVAAATGGGFSAGEGAGRFLLAVVGGVAAGLLVAGAVALVERAVEDSLVRNAVSLATPFAAYALAETVEGSGVLAIVVAGLLVAHGGARLGTGESRLQTGAVWRLVEYLLEGYVFLLIGQQVPDVLDGLRAYDAGTVVAATGATLAAVLLVRLWWMLVLRRRTPLGGREGVALWWSGTRGVITLATVYALPGSFPERDLVVFCALAVVLVTLVGQGLTFGPVLRALRLESPGEADARLRGEARVAALEAAIARVDEVARVEDLPDDVVRGVREQLERARGRMRARLDDDAAQEAWTGRRAAVGVLRQAIIDAQREELLRRRDAGRLGDDDLRRLERQLDLQELSLS